MQFNFWLKVSRATFLKCFYLERLGFFGKSWSWVDVTRNPEDRRVTFLLWVVSPNFLQFLNLKMSGSFLPSAFLNPSVEPMDYEERSHLWSGVSVRYKSAIVPAWQPFWDWPKASHITGICIRVKASLSSFLASPWFPCVSPKVGLPCLMRWFQWEGNWGFSALPALSCSIQKQVQKDSSKRRYTWVRVKPWSLGIRVCLLACAHFITQLNNNNKCRLCSI